MSIKTNFFKFIAPNTIPAATLVNNSITDLQVSNTAAIALSKIAGIATGQIPFANSSTSLTSDALFFWDNLNKRLGVGRTPNSFLDVFGNYNGGSYGMVNVESNGSECSLQLFKNSGTPKSYKIGVNNSQEFFINDGVNPRLTIASTGPVCIGGSSLYGDLLEIASNNAIIAPRAGQGGANLRLISVDNIITNTVYSAQNTGINLAPLQIVCQSNNFSVNYLAGSGTRAVITDPSGNLSASSTYGKVTKQSVTYTQSSPGTGTEVSPAGAFAVLIEVQGGGGGGGGNGSSNGGGGGGAGAYYSRFLEVTGSFSMSYAVGAAGVGGVGGGGGVGTNGTAGGQSVVNPNNGNFQIVANGGGGGLSGTGGGTGGTAFSNGSGSSLVFSGGSGGNGGIGGSGAGIIGLATLSLDLLTSHIPGSGGSSSIYGGGGGGGGSILGNGGDGAGINDPVVGGIGAGGGGGGTGLGGASRQNGANGGSGLVRFTWFYQQ